MNRKLSVLLLIILGSFIIHPVFSQKKSENVKILFVGNSYTYFWNLAQTVEAMAQSNNVDLTVRKSTAGGTTWKQHWEGDKGLQSRKIITESDWDIVVLQNHSKSTMDDLDQFMEYGARFIDLVKESGAKPVLYETWARAYNPLMLGQIKKGYHDLADKHSVEVVHVGEIWEMALDLRPGLRLFDPDESHPSTIGTYLTACAFYTFLSGNKAMGLDERISKTDGDGELLYLSIMSKDNAYFLQEVVDTFNRKGQDE